MWQTGQATNHKTLVDDLVAIATSRHVATAVINAAGTGYVVDDILSVAGGTSSPAGATLRVTSVGGSGDITGLRVETGGAYTVDPTTTANSVTGGTGSSATVDLTMAETGWTAVQDDSNVGADNDRFVILEGANGGVSGDEVYVGLHTQQFDIGVDTFHEWQVHGFSGFNGSLAFDDQPGISPARAYVPLRDDGSFPIDYWMSINDRRIIVVARVQDATLTRYSSCYMGLFNPFATEDEYPYPICVIGSTNRNNSPYDTSNPDYSGLTELIAQDGQNGPMYVRDGDGTWQSIHNSEYDSGANSRSDGVGRILTPLGHPNLTGASSPDNIVDEATAGLFTEQFAPTSGTPPGTPTWNFALTPNTGDDIRPLFPCSIIYPPSAGDDIVGQLDNVYWVPGVSLSSEDVIVTSDDRRFRVFQGGQRSEEYSFFAIEEI